MDGSEDGGGAGVGSSGDGSGPLLAGGEPERPGADGDSEGLPGRFVSGGVVGVADPESVGVGVGVGSGPGSSGRHVTCTCVPPGWNVTVPCPCEFALRETWI